MRKLLCTILPALGAFAVRAAEPVTGIKVERSEKTLIVSMTIDPSAVPPKINREEWFRPVITDGTDSLWLKPVLVAGRTRYYQRLRAGEPSADACILLRAGKDAPCAYAEMTTFAPWMERSTLQLVREVDGCCGVELEPAQSADVAQLDFRQRHFVPELVYVRPAVEAVKTREVHGSARIDFRINRTEIDPSYRRNPEELAAIRATIDAVKDDADVTITSLSIKGFASPDGPCANNGRLAKGRTEALVGYVRELYSFPAGLVSTSWEAEDWEGLARRVRASDLKDREAILAVVADDALRPDAREQRLKARFPEQYAFLLREVYPALRRSDYAVSYRVRNYVSVEEIAAVLAEAPQKLSLEEIFRYANGLDRESPEFREAMEVAVRMYPRSEAANLNAAVTAVGRADFDRARAYLAKAGDSPEAVYTRGILEAATGNYAEAAALLQAAGTPEAQRAVEQLRELEFIR